MTWLRSSGQAQGWALPDAHLLRDAGYSGATLKRPGLDRLRDTVRAHELDRVILTDPDRLARKYGHHMVRIDAVTQGGATLICWIAPCARIRLTSSCCRFAVR